MMYMDVSLPLITLHPGARDFLFEHYRTITRVFRDVLGLLEVDYLAISLITSENELLFLSSQPSIECNLIEQNLWQSDPCLNEHFFEKNSPQFWDEIYNQPIHKKLLYYKQESFKFGFGLAIPQILKQFRVIYTFGFKTTDIAVKNKAENNIERLTNMGLFCLQNILNKIALPNPQIHCNKKPSLKLIINNQVLHENIT